MVKDRIKQLNTENIVAYVVDTSGMRGLTESEYKSYLDKRQDYVKVSLKDLKDLDVSDS